MIVISLGGSLMVGEHGVNVCYLKKFIALIQSEVRRGKRFLIVCGGGYPARMYHQALRELHPKASGVEFHRVGLRATRVNAELLRAAFGNFAHPTILIDDQVGRVKLVRPIAIAGGGAPGRSTDYAAVLWAHRYGVTTVYNLTNVDGVYSSDPHKDRHAKHFDTLTWTQYQKVLGMKTWVANDHAPFDPLASRLAAHNGISAIILDGRNLLNFSRALRGQSFHGTAIGNTR